MRNQGSVKPTTRDRVLRVVEKLNYQPNALAQQLRTQETHTVIVIVPNIGNTFFHKILLGIELEAEKNGYQVLIADMHNEPAVENYYFNAIQQHLVDGIISLSASVAKSLMNQVASEYPIVVACQYIEGITPNITIDNVAAAKDMVGHLINLGHRRIAHLTSNPASPLYRDRFNGYLAALAQSGISVDLGLVQYCEPTINGGFTAMEPLLELNEPVTAVFAAGDTMAIGAMKRLKKAGLHVPEDIAIAGFDDIEISAEWEPALTTIHQPKFEIGQHAFSKLLKLIKKEPLLQTQEILDYSLIIRESCGSNRNKQ